MQVQQMSSIMDADNWWECQQTILRSKSEKEKEVKREVNVIEVLHMHVWKWKHEIH
jgi:hypothetical protein